MIVTEKDLIPVVVSRRRPLTPYICEFVLHAADGGRLPEYDPGAHVAVKTPSGAMRRYSLVGGGAPDTYTIAVKRELQSRGGSSSMHDEVHERTTLAVAPPENEFKLQQAADYLLIAGGIGVTPIYAMAKHLQQQNSKFEVIYVSRSQGDAAYLAEMQEAFGDRMIVHHDDGDPKRAYDFWSHFETPRPLHVYCCGPKPLMDEIKAISGHWPDGRVHFEDFKPVDVIRPDDRPFNVTLAKSGQTIHVPADRSILETIRDCGFRTISSCESGTCGSCKTRLISGEVEHRDMVLLDEEKSNRIMICVSRAKDEDLVIDL